MNKIHNIIAASVCMIFAGCLSHPEYLESKYFWQRQINIVENATNVCISISGLCGHSSLGVDRPEESMDEDILTIEFPLRFGASGSIHETVIVPNHINIVKLAGDVIWERNRAKQTGDSLRFSHVGECWSAVLSSTQWPNAPKNMNLRATWNYEGMRGIMALNGSNVCQNVAATAVAGNSKTKDPVQSEKVLTAEEIVTAFSSENKKEGLKQQANRGCAKIGISTATYCDPSNEHFLIIYEIYDPSGNGALKRGNVSGQVNAEKMCAENVRSNGADTNTHGTVEVVERKNDFRSLSVPKKCKSTNPEWGLRLIVHDGDDVVCDAVVY